MPTGVDFTGKGFPCLQPLPSALSNESRDTGIVLLRSNNLHTSEPSTRNWPSQSQNELTFRQDPMWQQHRGVKGAETI